MATPFGARTEEFLREFKIPYDYEENYPLTQIHPKMVGKVISAQGRTETRLDKALVDALAKSFADGHTPQTSVIDAKTGRLVDGHHTYAGAKQAGLTVVPVFRIRASSKLLEDQLEAAINNSHGHGYTQKEKRDAALRFLQNGLAESRVAGLVGLPLSTLRAFAAVSKLADRLHEAGVEDVNLEDLALTTCQSLNQIRNLPTLVGALQLVRDAGMKTDEVKALVRRLAQAQSQGEEMEILREVREEYEGRIQAAAAHQGNGKYTTITRPVWQQAIPALSMLTKYEASRYVATLPSERFDETKRRWQQLARNATAVIAQLESYGAR